MYRRTPLQWRALGFIGLGQMGGRMAPLARQLGVTDLYVADTSATAVENLKAQLDGTPCRVQPCESPAQVAAGAHDVITMLPNPDVVRAVYTGGSGLLSAAGATSLFVDCSTVDPGTSRAMAAAALKVGAAFADAPVSGGVVAAAAGTLVFMVGAATPAVFERVKALLAPFAKSVVHAGDVGAGSVCKICNNMVLGQHMVAVSEAMLLGTRLGVDPKTLAELIGTSSGRCWSVDTYNPYPGVCPIVPASHGYEGGFESRLMLKDMNLALRAASEARLDVSGAANAQRMYDALVKDGKYATKDFAAMLQYIDTQSPAAP